MRRFSVGAHNTALRAFCRSLLRQKAFLLRANRTGKTMSHLKKLFLALLVFCFTAGPAQAGQKALMLTVFGTSTEAAITFDELLPLAEARFPDRKIVVPYTSGIIREKLNAAISDPTKKILSPEEMLITLKNNGFDDIAVVSTLLFPGVEHEKLQATVETFRAANAAIAVHYTPPFLSTKENRLQAVHTLRKYLLPGAANVVVAHGTHAGHAAEAAYYDIAGLVAKTYPNARFAGIEGVPSMDGVLQKVKDDPAREVRFVVFMFVAGDHAENDIASAEEGSLFSLTRAMGKTPSVAWAATSGGRRIASLGLDPEYRNLLLDWFARNVPAVH